MNVLPIVMLLAALPSLWSAGHTPPQTAPPSIATPAAVNPPATERPTEQPHGEPPARETGQDTSTETEHSTQDASVLPRDVEITDVISREFIVLAGPTDEPDDVISRDFVVEAVPDTEPLDTVSREFVVEVNLPGPQDNISREVAVFSVIPLQLGVPYTGELPVGAELRFKVTVDAGLTARVFLDHASPSASTQLFVAYEAFPDDNAEFSSAMPFEPDQEVVVPSTLAGAYYILARNTGDQNSSASSSFSITVSTLAFGAQLVEPPVVGASEVTLRLTGGHLDMAANVRLRPSGGGPDISAVKLSLPDAAHLRARFDLTGVALGAYDLVTQLQGGPDVVLSQAVTVEAPNEIHVETTGVPSPFIRSGHFHNTGTTWVFVTNPRNIDAPVVGLTVFAPNGPDLSLLLDGDDDVPFVGNQDYQIAQLLLESVAPGERIAVPIRILVGPGFPGPKVELYPYASVRSRADFLQTQIIGGGGWADRAIEFLRTQPDLPPNFEELIPSIYQEFADVYNEQGLTPTGVARSAHPLWCLVICNVGTAAIARVPGMYYPAQAYRAWLTYCCFNVCSDECLRIGVDCPPPPPENCCTVACGECARCVRLIPCGPPGTPEYFDGCCVCVGGHCTPGGSSTDPNKKEGPAGRLEQRFVPQTNTQAYRIYFENDPNAAVAAALVQVDDALVSSLDPATFRVHEFVFGATTVHAPEDRSSYQTIVDLRPDQNLLVDVRASIEAGTNVARFTMQALDPDTMQAPQDATVGFLPPNDATGRGEGYVEFSVGVGADVPSGTVVTNQATITFDYNDPMSTNVVFNTIDAGAPTSQVLPLPPQSVTPLWVQLAGSDDVGGCGIAEYQVFVATDGGPFTFWQATADTAVAYSGQIGHTYEFHSVAVDYVGNTEATPTAAQATTTVIGNAQRLDLNLDGYVNIADLALLASCLSGPEATSDAPRCPRTDLNGDGAVDLVDLAEFQTRYAASASVRGDLNCDGAVTFADIDPFVLALSDAAAYAATYPDCGIFNADCNDDGRVDFDDIDPFVALFGGPVAHRD